MKTRELVAGRPQSVLPLPHLYCPGCHHGSVFRLLGEVIDDLGIQKKTIGCLGVGCHAFGCFFLNTDMVSCLHGRAPSVATGVKRALYGEPVVFTIQGDGDLAAIGMGSILNAAIRGEKLTTVFCNNAGYGTTGGQLAPTTLLGQKTTTTPAGREPATEGYPVHMAELMATMKGVVYSARCSLTNRANYNRAFRSIRKAFQKQIDGVGYGFVEILEACPSTLKMSPKDALRWVESHMMEEYPLGEFKDVNVIE